MTEGSDNGGIEDSPKPAKAGEIAPENPADKAEDGDATGGVPLIGNVRDWIKSTFKGRNGDSPRDVLDELIEEREESSTPIDDHERVLIRNILHLRDVTAADVMVPRAQMVAVEAAMPLKDVTEVMGRSGHSRLPVYRRNLDDVIGMIHIKDLMAPLRRGKAKKIVPFMRPIMFVSPAMRVMDLLLEMRQKRNHIALVVDEYGGIDGLVTIEDLVEQIVGEIEDEHDIEGVPPMSREDDGALIADGRTEVGELEAVTGPVLTDDERDGTDTIGGLVFHVADRIPAIGEVIAHSSGIEFEILQADPRRIKKVRIRNLPSVSED